MFVSSPLRLLYLTRNQELLQNYTARQIRLAFLGQLWSNRMDMGEGLQGEVKAREAAFDVRPCHLHLIQAYALCRTSSCKSKR